MVGRTGFSACPATTFSAQVGKPVLPHRFIFLHRLENLRYLKPLLHKVGLLKIFLFLLTLILSSNGGEEIKMNPSPSWERLGEGG